MNKNTKNMTFQEYIDYTNTPDYKYVKMTDSIVNSPIRLSVHQQFPYIFTMQMDHYYMAELERDLKKDFGYRHGQCYNDFCEFTFDPDKYQDKHPATIAFFNDPNHQEILKEFKGVWLLDSKHPLKKQYEQVSKIVSDSMENNPDCYDDHSHIGCWTTHYIRKTGYDYGWVDFCFKNELDATIFKLKYL